MHMNTGYPYPGEERTVWTSRRALAAIGAPADALEPLVQLLRVAPDMPSLAFVVAGRLLAGDATGVAATLRSEVRKPVELVSETLPLAANHVYLVPAQVVAWTFDTHVRVAPAPGSAAPDMPMDELFRAVSRSVRRRAIGVLLTASASADGVAGAQAIQAQGGLVLCGFQSGSSQSDGSMAARLVDPPGRERAVADMAEDIRRFIRMRSELADR